jgi:hypothetical protein
MALPNSVETPRLLYLRSVVDGAIDGEWTDWPMLTEKDYTQFGKIIVLFSYIDVSIRRIVEAAGNAGILGDAWKGRVRKLNITEAEEAVMSLDWSDENRVALTQIADRRGLRNLVAHFAVRRFPDDDAFLFFTKSDRDFKRLFGKEPDPGMIMYSVMESPHLDAGFRHILNLQLWITKAAAQAEHVLITLKPNTTPDDEPAIRQ